MPENQQVVFLSDGGEDVRRVQAYLHPNREHLMDWFPIPMRWTVWQQQTKALPEERLQTTGAAASKQVESIQHWLWHGHVEEALERVANRILDFGSDGEALRGGRETVSRADRIRDLHGQPPGIDPQLW